MYPSHYLALLFQRSVRTPCLAVIKNSKGGPVCTGAAGLLAGCKALPVAQQALPARLLLRSAELAPHASKCMYTLVESLFIINYKRNASFKELNLICATCRPQRAVGKRIARKPVREEWPAGLLASYEDLPEAEQAALLAAALPTMPAHWRVEVARQTGATAQPPRSFGSVVRCHRFHGPSRAAGRRRRARRDVHTWTGTPRPPTAALCM